MMLTHEEPFSVRRKWTLVATLTAAVVAFALWRAWVTDDAFITFRHVANCLDGYGPVFNAGYRVQGFTHPLWFLLLCCGGLIMDLYAWAVTLGLVSSAMIIVLLGWFLRGTPQAPLRLVLATAFLLSSRTFVEFQTSGLETSLAHVLIVALFGGLLAQAAHDRPPHVVGASLLGALLLLTRPDYLILCTPILVLLVARAVGRHRFHGLVRLLPAALLLIGWYGFATIYYGTPLPNTAYAKIALPLGEAIQRGGYYVFIYAEQEPFHAGLILTVLVASLALPLGRAKWRQPDVRIIFCLGLSLVLHTMYVISIGGDFMRGRFLAPTLVGGAVLGADLLRRALPARDLSRSFAVVLALALPMVGVIRLRAYLPVPWLSGLESLRQQTPAMQTLSATSVVLFILFAAWSVVRRHRVVARPDMRGLLLPALAAYVLLLDMLVGHWRLPCVSRVAFTATLAISMLLVRRLLDRGTAPPAIVIVPSVILFAAVCSLLDVDRRIGQNLVAGGEIADEYSWYAGQWYENRFIKSAYEKSPIPASWDQFGRAAAHYAQNHGPIAISLGALGAISYLAGPEVRIIDDFGLTDAYIARRPAHMDSRVGHITRDVPISYYQSHGTIHLLPDWQSRMDMLDPSLRSEAQAMIRNVRWTDEEAYRQWLDVQKVISGDLFSMERLRLLPWYALPQR